MRLNSPPVIGFWLAVELQANHQMRLYYIRREESSHAIMDETDRLIKWLIIKMSVLVICTESTSCFTIFRNICHGVFNLFECNWKSIWCYVNLRFSIPWNSKLSVLFKIVKFNYLFRVLYFLTCSDGWYLVAILVKIAI